MITVTRQNNKISFKAPFHPAFPKPARNLGGDWRDKESSWVFDVRDEERVAELYKSVYGFIEEDNRVVDIRVHVKHEIEVRRGAYFFAGREIAKARGRDSGAILGEGVVVVSGGFASGGSSKNWMTVVKTGTVFEVRDVYLHAAKYFSELLGFCDEGESVDILDGTPRHLVELDATGKPKRSPASDALLIVELANLRDRLARLSREATDIGSCIAALEQRLER